VRLLCSIALLIAGCGEAASTGAGGDFTFAVTSDPSPLGLGRNTLYIEVTADGAPVDGAQVEVDPEMPAHGHGSTESPQVEALGGGRYRAFPVTLHMPGHWVIGLHATKGDLAADDSIEVRLR
jgi:hypothetical protein